MAAPAQRLLKWQRNKIVESIQAAGLDPREFDLNDSDAGFLIKHKWSESFFDIVGVVRCPCTRAAQIPNGGVRGSPWPIWPSVMVYLKTRKRASITPLTGCSRAWASFVQSSAS